MIDASLALWLLAVSLYGVGDLVTTMVGLRHEGLEEGTPFVRWLLGEPPSAWRFGLVKAVLLAGFYVGFVLLEGYRIRLLVPIGIAVIGACAVVNNVRAIRSRR